MKPENLKNLLYFYIEEKRGYDYFKFFGDLAILGVDSPAVQESALGEYDKPQRRASPCWFTDGGYSISTPQSSISPNPVTFQYVPLTALQRAETADAGRKLVKMTEEFFTSQPNRSGVKFKSSCIFVTPELQTVDIPIIRSPDCDDIPLKILWKTRDRTAQSGIHYIDSSGEIIFDKDATQAVIPIEILSSAPNSDDLRFQLDLSVENCAHVPKPMTVNIQNMNNLYEDERAVVNNLLQSSASTVSEVIFFLDSKWSLRTFHSGLSYMCSKADSIPLEIGLALDLATESLQSLPYEQVFKVLNNFFRKDEYEF